jgi:hypothetical protein
MRNHFLAQLYKLCCDRKIFIIAAAIICLLASWSNNIGASADDGHSTAVSGKQTPNV